jgi:DNA-binding Lrp family transcriptional regulator
MRSRCWLLFDGRWQTIAEWAKEMGMSPQLLRWRVRRWPVAQALTKEIRAWNPL